VGTYYGDLCPGVALARTFVGIHSDSLCGTGVLSPKNRCSRNVADMKPRLIVISRLHEFKSLFEHVDLCAFHFSKLHLVDITVVRLARRPSAQGPSEVVSPYAASNAQRPPARTSPGPAKQTPTGKSGSRRAPQPTARALSSHPMMFQMGPIARSILLPARRRRSPATRSIQRARGWPPAPSRAWPPRACWRSDR
jgi:hypothetical protein